MRTSFVATALVSAVLVRAETHLVKVGDGGLAFNPTSITAVEGDTIAFQFQAKNHSVTQSSFLSPCTPVAGGVDSNFVNVPAGSTSLPQWSITVNDVSAPLWFFCKQVPPAPALSHCQSGMVFAVNPTQQKTFAQFQTTAKASAPAGGASSTNGTTTSGGTTSTNGTTTSGTTSTNGTATGSDASGSTTSASGSTTGSTSTGSSDSTGSGTADNSSASTTGAPSSAMKLGGSAAGIMTALALLVSFVL